MSQHPSAAAAAEELAAWADALDVDDYDLCRTPASSSLSTHRSCPASKPEGPDPSHRRIPAPAAPLVGDAMRLRSPLPYSSPAARADGQAADPDFLLSPWLHALRSLGEDRALKRQDIAAIKDERALYRARLVVGIVTSCSPNGLGDLFLSLKDPTGTIGASVHRKVFPKEDGRAVSIGSVVVLKKVAVFRPSHKACYLNITQENVELLVPKDFGFPSKQVVSSSPSESQQYPAVKCTETMSLFCQGDNHIGRRIEAGTFGETTVNAVQASTLRLRMDKESTQGAENHDIRLRETYTNPSNKNIPSYKTNQQMQKQVYSISPVNCHQRQGSPSKHESSEAECSVSSIMMRLLGGRSRMGKTVAEVSCDHRGTPDASNSTSRMDTDASFSSGKHQEIGHQTLMERLSSRHISNHYSEERHQKKLNLPKDSNTSSQASLCGRSVTSVTEDSITATSDERLRRPFEGEGMVPSSKKPRSDAALLDCNIMSSTNVKTYGLENSLNIELDDVAQEFPVEHTSNKKSHEHQLKDGTATVGTVQPTQENRSITTSGATTISLSSRMKPDKLLSADSVTQWTDDQLSELFADY